MSKFLDREARPAPRAWCVLRRPEQRPIVRRCRWCRLLIHGGKIHEPLFCSIAPEIFLKLDAMWGLPSRSCEWLRESVKRTDFGSKLGEGVDRQPEPSDRVMRGTVDDRPISLKGKRDHSPAFSARKAALRQRGRGRVHYS